MKRLLPIFIFILISLFAYSQDQSGIIKPIKKGNLIIGGDLKFDGSGKSDEVNYPAMPPISDYKSTQISFSVSPDFGYFVTDGLVIGVSPAFQYTYSKTRSLTGIIINPKVNSFGLGGYIFIKYYLENCIFFEFETGYMHDWSSSNGFDKATSDVYSFIPGIGYAIFINPKVSIEPKINYEFNRFTMKSVSMSDKQTSNSISFSVAFTMFL
jgi:hypothetical protein